MPSESLRTFMRRTWMLPLAFAMSACIDSGPTEPVADQQIGRNASVTAPPGYIRIGVVQGADVLQLGGTGNYHVIDAASGNVLFSGNGDAAAVTVESVPVITTFWRLQVSCSSLAAAQDWVPRVIAAGYEPYLEDAGFCWRMRVGRFPTQQAAKDANATLFALGLSPSSAPPANFQTSRVTITEGVTVYQVTHNGTTIQNSGPVRVVAVDGQVTIGGARYRGIGEARFNPNNGQVAGINELHMEEYLLGVVPRELGPVAFPYLEALKAQAVAARTYAYRNLGKQGTHGYDLTATVSDQVYGGAAAEHPLSNQAVLETADVVATYNGALIETLYSSTSGGWTANSEDVFSTPLPYLRGVPDRQTGNALDQVPSLEVFRNHANPVSLRNEDMGAYEADWAPRHRWYVSWTAEEMRELASGHFGTNVGQVYEVNVVERANSGRALRLEIVAENGTFVKLKDGIRSGLRFYTNSGAVSSLHSTLFYIQPVKDNKTKAITGWEAWGGGWGHGVGLSQTGAVGMAERGNTYEEILKYYYRGITLETR